ncbi:MAG: N-acetylneuraminate synthase family protein [Cylindrospermopsis raciborskii]|uniref:N-acetylneuraminate synthase family protein n=1 Tax=Cylindrospermopsis raciborskii TaxID=77022 RepID=UPI003D13FC86
MLSHCCSGPFRKHFTLSRADKVPDSEFSLEPADLERLCQDAKDAWLDLGKPGFERQQAEEGGKVFRRSKINK